ncbi:hypothetical protein G7Y79_00029g063050 [Physcia stellaris]|nr:hypothetical protein G7Y79_00029g063050 [Physcia stellaris]
MATPIALTTFTPPPNCLSNTYRYGDNQLVGPMASSCYPSGWTNTSTTYYSPAACPSGYTTACITANTANTITETVATCCPSHFACASSGNLDGCGSSIPAQTPVRMTVMDSSFVSISTIETQYIGGYVNAFGVQIRFQATDLIRPISTVSTSTPSTQGTSSSTLGGLTSPSSTPTNTPSPALSTGAKAGIGVGAAIGGLLILAFLFIGGRHITKRRKVVGTHSGRGAMMPEETEHKSYPVYEVPEDEIRRELPEHKDGRRHELYEEGRGIS